MAFQSQGTLDRFFPVPAQKTYQELLRLAKLRFTVKSSDDFTMTINFSSGMSAFSSGENYSAQVIPAEGDLDRNGLMPPVIRSPLMRASLIKVSGAGKMGGSIPQQSRSFKLINQLFNDVVNSVRPK